MSKKDKNEAAPSAPTKPSRKELKHARHLLKLGGKWLWIQRDIMSQRQIESCNAALERLRTTLDTESWQNVPAAIGNVERQFESVRPTDRFAAWRENFEAIFVALVIAGAVRTYFVQPFKIPTGSMQPTLYGIHETAKLRVESGSQKGREFELETAIVGRAADNDIVLKDEGVSEHHAKFVAHTTYSGKYRIAVSSADGVSKISVNGIPIEGPEDLHLGDRLQIGKTELSVVALHVSGGDRIFVDRFTYNFVKPNRGDVIVFRTRHVRSHPENADFYIKRLVGLPGETVQIKNGKLCINDRLIDSPPIFKKLYTKPSDYDCYLTPKDMGAIRSDVVLYDENSSYTLSRHGYFVFGDNTRSSADSRYWGEFPREDLIGRAFTIYWPLARIRWIQ